MKKIFAAVIVTFLFTTYLFAGLVDDVNNTALSFVDDGSAFLSAGVLSAAGAEGGLPHFDAGLGINLTTFRFTDPVHKQEVKFPGFFPVAYGALGIYNGISLTPLISGVGSIDLLARVSPSLINDTFFVKKPNYIAFGAKVQILKDQLVPPTPAISFTVMTHNVSGLDFKFDTVYTSFKLDNLSLHADVSKSLLLIAPYAGIGYDMYSLTGTYHTESNAKEETIAKINGNHLRYYGGLRFKVLLAKVFVEGAYIGKKTIISMGISAGI